MGRIFRVAVGRRNKERLIMTESSGKNILGKKKKSDEKKAEEEKEEEEEEDNLDYTDLQRNAIDLDRLVSTLRRRGHMKEICRPHPPHRIDQVAVPLRSAEVIKEAIKVVSWELLSEGTLDSSDCWKVDDCELNGAHGSAFHGWVRKVNVPLTGDITLHFSKASAVPYGSGIGTDDTAAESIPVVQTKQGPQSTRFKDEDVNCKDNQNKMTVKGITMSGCTLFPGSQEWIKYAVAKARVKYIKNMEDDLRAADKDVSNARAELDYLVSKAEDLEKKIKNLKSSNKEQQNADTPAIQSGSFQIDSLFNLENVVCGAEKDCSYSLKEKLGAMAELDNAYAQKRQDNALESTVDALHSVKRKEFASRLRWTALCINAARLGEILSDIAVAEKANSASRAEKSVKTAFEALCTEIDDLDDSMEKSKRKIKTLKESVCTLQSRIHQQSRANGENKSDMQGDERLIFDLMDEQLKLELAQADPDVSSKRIAVAKDTAKMLTLISNADNAHQSLEQALRSKYHARLHSQIALYRYQEAVELMALCGAEAHSHSQSSSVGELGTISSNEVKARAIKARYQGKIKSVEQELLSCTGEVTAGVENRNKEDKLQNDTLDNDREESKAAIRILTYEIEVSQERVKAEETRNALWTRWSAAAERTSSHRPKDLSIVMAFESARESRHKVTAAVQSCRNEEAKVPNAQIPSWLTKEPTWPAGIKQDAWWPTKTASDTEKSCVALVASADRAVNLARKRIYGTSAEPATKHSLWMATKQQLALIAAQDAQQGPAKITSELATAANHLKQLSGPVRH